MHGMNHGAMHVLKRPLITEKSTKAQEGANVYAFEVALNATKDDIRDAVETSFNVKVEKVNTSRSKGKDRRLKYGWVHERETKKAFVRLREGDVIELF
jgi:large subunit ribosomal protein L23